jgi:hypothetical protein
MHPEAVYSLTYVSSAVRPYSPEELRVLLTAARLKNDQHGITGMLLYKDGNFMQVLEGERNAVQATRARIEVDPKHHGMLVLLSGPIEHREFGSWSMAYRDLGNPENRNVPGYDEFLNTPLNHERFVKEPAASRKLLAVFKRHM